MVTLPSVCDARREKERTNRSTCWFENCLIRVSRRRTAPHDSCAKDTVETTATLTLFPLCDKVMIRNHSRCCIGNWMWSARSSPSVRTVALNAWRAQAHRCGPGAHGRRRGFDEKGAQARGGEPGKARCTCAEQVDGRALARHRAASRCPRGECAEGQGPRGQSNGRGARADATAQLGTRRSR